MQSVRLLYFPMQGAAGNSLQLHQLLLIAQSRSSPWSLLMFWQRQNPPQLASPLLQLASQTLATHRLGLHCFALGSAFFCVLPSLLAFWFLHRGQAMPSLLSGVCISCAPPHAHPGLLSAPCRSTT